MDLVQSNLLDSTRCIEFGVDTQVMGFVNRVPYSDTGLEAYVCGPCVSVWEERDIWRGGEQIYCPMEDDEKPDIVGTREYWNDEDPVEELVCDEYEKTHREQWFPEVDAKFPDAPAFREEMRRRNDA